MDKKKPRWTSRPLLKSNILLKAVIVYAKGSPIDFRFKFLFFYPKKCGKWGVTGKDGEVFPHGMIRIFCSGVNMVFYEVFAQRFLFLK